MDFDNVAIKKMEFWRRNDNNGPTTQQNYNMVAPSQNMDDHVTLHSTLHNSHAHMRQ